MGIKNVFNKVKDKTKETVNKGTSFVQSKITKAKEKQTEKKQDAIDDYQLTMNEVIETIENPSFIEFLTELGESPIILNLKNADKIKHIFPIPIEQTILWADCEFDLRPSGVALTEKGIYIKTDVTIKEEKIDKRLSELFYYPFEQFDSSMFVDDKREDNKLMLIDEKCKRRFHVACIKFDNKENLKRAELENREEQLFNSKNKINEIVNPAIVAGAGVSLSSIEVITRNNSAANTNAGHGIMAEHGNTLNDLYHFKNAKVIGGDNAKNGADRLVNNQLIQTKYYKTATGSVEAAFNPNGGNYRYVDGNGNLMKLEVPSDQYKAAVAKMDAKIQAGKVMMIDENGNQIPFEGRGEDIITKGHYTYEQACNLAKAGTIESLTYDIKTGAVVGLGAFGISFIINTFISYSQNHDLKTAVFDGLSAGGKVFALTVLNHVAISQLSRTPVFKEIITKGALQSGLVAGAVALIVFSIPETYKLATKKISKAQYAANLLCLGASIAGGTAGAAAGSAAVASAESAALTVGASIAGGLVGGLALGALVTVGIKVVYEGDDAKHTRLFNAITTAMMCEYLLTANEMDKFINLMNSTDAHAVKKLFDKLGPSKHQEKLIREFLAPYFESIIKEREKVAIDFYDVDLVNA